MRSWLCAAAVHILFAWQQSSVLLIALQFLHTACFSAYHAGMPLAVT
jgi:hypothetical protein